MAVVKNNPEYWEKRIASGTWKTYNSLEEKNRELLDFYMDASKSIKNELYDIAEKYSKDGILTLSEMHKQNRLTELNKKYEQIALELGKQTEDTSRKNMQDGFQKVYQNTSVGLGETDFALPNKKLMEKLLNEPWRGNSFSGRLWKNQKKLASGLNDILLIGLQQGKTVTEMAVNLHNFMGQAFNNCHRLVRTEAMHYLNNAALQGYIDSGVQYVQIWAAEDERTCPECAKYHGKIYPIDKAPILPLHAHCRCTYLPVIEEELIKKYESKAEKSGIMKSRSMANGMRTSPHHVLSDLEIDSIRADAKNIGIPEEVLCYNKGSQTGFSDFSERINVKGDILPDPTSNHPRDCMSQKAVLAHEYYGHYKNHPSVFRVGDWRDEFRASYRAAIDTPKLSEEERRSLMLDAYDRAKEAGVSVKYNKEARRMIYGYDE